MDGYIRTGRYICEIRFTENHFLFQVRVLGYLKPFQETLLEIVVRKDGSIILINFHNNYEVV